MKPSQLLMTAIAVLIFAAPVRAFDTSMDEDELDDPAAIERARPPVYDGYTEYGEPAPEYGDTEPAPRWRVDERRGHEEDLDTHESPADDDGTSDENGNGSDEGLEEALPLEPEAPGYRDRRDFEEEHELEPSAPVHGKSPGGRVEKGLDRAGAATRRGLRGVADPVGRGLERAMKGTGRGLHKAIDETGDGLHKAGDAFTGESPKSDTE